ncbi:MAG: DUF433 domain-containing protein [Candidatus Omnitrophica bacterium]|nr:DUF433 domain-containing protein [Candidatus Omnitrophota bacterium]MBU1524112.1 DUF433 domain-containing protein [Candidatus Omnitrophota bacterium]MBU1809856.1 DUF433 domain-containing protein [Candidatus Omnitrophota bacterium]MBU2436740.1 DUF433 domain-containing protein [Candidatus Omnitrophota bacterium]MBU2505059.1 DUF433 domain-containing protein [Candidatus Omnitrophota bacterium]
MDIRNYITCHPAICGGDPVFKETRIPIYLVLDLIEGGIAIQEIRKRYYPQLSLEAIKAAIHYASEIIKTNEFVPFNPVEA